ncbi:MAG: hypothetical protein H5T59_00795 [Anaerolineae bacterium]|nr:hypothetical protein [Anaerolineae bacterium]
MYEGQTRWEKEMEVHARWMEALNKRLGEDDPRAWSLSWTEEGLAAQKGDEKPPAA